MKHLYEREHRDTGSGVISLTLTRKKNWVWVRGDQSNAYNEKEHIDIGSGESESVPFRRVIISKDSARP